MALSFASAAHWIFHSLLPARRGRSSRRLCSSRPSAPTSPVLRRRRPSATRTWDCLWRRCRRRATGRRAQLGIEIELAERNGFVGALARLRQVDRRREAVQRDWLAASTGLAGGSGFFSGGGGLTSGLGAFVSVFVAAGTSGLFSGLGTGLSGSVDFGGTVIGGLPDGMFWPLGRFSFLYGGVFAERSLDTFGLFSADLSGGVPTSSSTGLSFRPPSFPPVLTVSRPPTTWGAATGKATKPVLPPPPTARRPPPPRQSFASSY